MFKNVILGVALLAASLASGAAKPADYSGAWTLDMKQSKNLPSFYANVRSHKLQVTQDWGHMRVAVEVDDGRGEPFRANFDYDLAGAETKTETTMRTPAGTINVPTTLKAEPSEDGGLHITIKRDVHMGERNFKSLTVEEWRLGPGGKTLNIHRADDTPRGKMESDMVFVRG